MSYTDAHKYRLEITLPSGWNLVQGPELRETLRGDLVAVLDSARRAVDLVLDADSSALDLVATLYMAVSDYEQRPLGLLTAAMVAIAMDRVDLPAPDHPAFAIQEVDGVELLDGLPTSYLVLTIPVISEDQLKVELLTFSSPNVGIAPLLEHTFRSIGSTANVLVRD